MPSETPDLRSAAQTLRTALAQRVVGQDQAVEELLTAVFAGGHCMLLGVPGLAKTLLVKSLSECLDLGFSRIQFTPDLMPTDITGTEVIMANAQGERGYRFLNGPIFANLVLADEINRTPPKTQAALLEAMEEAQVTAGGERYALPPPFLVMGTQNPIEQEGTYPLPMAALDRFLFMVKVGYPEAGEERRIVVETLPREEGGLTPVLSRAQFLACQEQAQSVEVPSELLNTATRLVRMTRPQEPNPPAATRDFIRWGASPRGVQAMISASRARAALSGRTSITRDDLVAVSLPALRHRLVLNFHAEAEGISPDRVINDLLADAGLVERRKTQRRNLWRRILAGGAAR